MEVSTLKRFATALIVIFLAIGLYRPVPAAASPSNDGIEITGGTKWVDRIPNYLTGGIAYNGEYVLMNPHSHNIWYKSTDGLNWEPVEAQELRNGVVIDGVGGVKRLIWDGKQFVAITQFDVLTSPDGKLWQRRFIAHPDPGKEYILADIVFTGDVYIIAAQDREKDARLYFPGPNTFLVSKDLQTFETGTTENMSQSVGGERPVDFLATNGTVTIAGGNGSAVTFNNGKHWIGPGSKSFGVPYAGFSAIWDGRQFVHAFGETITTSTDGKTWKTHAIKVAGDNGQIDVANIAFNGVEYIAVTNHSIFAGPLVIYRSYDLVNWQKVEVPSADTNVIQILPFRDGFILLGTHTWLYRNHHLSVPSDWAEAGVQAAREQGLASDAILNNYRKPITRAEFAEVSVRLYDRLTGGETWAGLDEAQGEERGRTSGEAQTPASARNAAAGGSSKDAGETPFRDTNNPYVIRAYQLGIVAGKGEGKFAPFEPITRQDMAVMLVKMLDAAGFPVDRIDRRWAKAYDDLDRVASYAVEALQFMNAEGIIQGSGASIQPQQTATREQALVIAARVLERFQTAGAERAE
jgi:hypothetical protein